MEVIDYKNVTSHTLALSSCQVDSREPAGPYTTLNTGLVSGLTHTDQTVQSGKIYYYNLTAVDGNGVESQFAGEVGNYSLPVRRARRKVRR